MIGMVFATQKLKRPPFAVRCIFCSETARLIRQSCDQALSSFDKHDGAFHDSRCEWRYINILQIPNKLLGTVFASADFNTCSTVRKKRSWFKPCCI